MLALSQLGQAVYNLKQRLEDTNTIFERCDAKVKGAMRKDGNKLAPSPKSNGATADDNSGKIRPHISCDAR